jgi:hypothetical protein
MGIRRLVPGTDPSGAIRDVYSLGREFPHGRAPALPTKANPNPPRYGGGDGLELDAKHNTQAIQSREDARAAGYDNDVPVKSWLRGGALPPHFDHSQPRSKMRR